MNYFMFNKMFLKVSFILFFGSVVVIANADNISEKIIVKELLKTSASWDGKTLLNYPQGTPEITILKVIIPPGAQIPSHSHPIINAAVLLKGNLTVITEKNEKLRVTAGQACAEVVNKWHYGKNEGKEPAELIVFYAGTKGQPLSIPQPAERY